MKKVISNFIATPMLVVIALLNTGCPMGLEYPISNPNTEKLDPRLLGIWVAKKNADHSPIKRVKISKINESTLEMEVLERGALAAFATNKFSAWVTRFNGADFLFADPDNENKYYHYIYSFDGNKLLLRDVFLLRGGPDNVTSQESLREQVAESMKDPRFLKEEPFELAKE